MNLSCAAQVGDRIFGYGAITKKDADGAVELYEGEAAVNAAMGIGRFRFRDGATYEGEVVAGKPHGDGRYYRADEFEFKGQRVPRRPTARARASRPRTARARRFVDGAPKGFGRGFVSFVDAKQGQARRRRAGARPRPAKTSRSNRFGSTFGRIGCSRRARSGERNSA